MANAQSEVIAIQFEIRKLTAFTCARARCRLVYRPNSFSFPSSKSSNLICCCCCPLVPYFFSSILLIVFVATASDLSHRTFDGGCSTYFTASASSVHGVFNANLAVVQVFRFAVDPAVDLQTQCGIRGRRRKISSRDTPLSYVFLCWKIGFISDTLTTI